jgi:cobalt-zinc-cadmium efflux system outer membrane protein
MQLSVPLQLFNRNQGNIYRAHAELAAAHEEARRIELLLQDRLTDALYRYQVAKMRADRYANDILPDADESLKLIGEGYRRGELSYLELLNAQSTFFRVNLAYVESLRDLRVSHAEIEGFLLSGGLQAVDR